MKNTTGNGTRKGRSTIERLIRARGLVGATQSKWELEDVLADDVALLKVRQVVSKGALLKIDRQGGKASVRSRSRRVDVDAGPFELMTAIAERNKSGDVVLGLYVDGDDNFIGGTCDCCGKYTGRFCAETDRCFDCHERMHDCCLPDDR
jgi:hypothetical protein